MAASCLHYVQAKYQSICNDSAFYKLLDSGGDVKLDRDFQIKVDLLLLLLLNVPPRARAVLLNYFLQSSPSMERENISCPTCYK